MKLLLNLATICFLIFTGCKQESPQQTSVTPPVQTPEPIVTETLTATRKEKLSDLLITISKQIEASHPDQAAALRVTARRIQLPTAQTLTLSAKNLTKSSGQGLDFATAFAITGDKEDLNDLKKFGKFGNPSTMLKPDGACGHICSNCDNGGSIISCAICVWCE